MVALSLYGWKMAKWIPKKDCKNCAPWEGTSLVDWFGKAFDSVHFSLCILEHAYITIHPQTTNFI